MRPMPVRPTAPRRARRRGTARLFVLGTAVALSAALSTAEAATPRVRRAEASLTSAVTGAQLDPALRQPRDFTIPAGTLADVVAAFTAATRIDVHMGLDSIGTIHSPGVSGRMAADDALRALLLGTGISARIEQSGRVVLEVSALAESVQVTGSGPAVTSPKYVVPMRNIPQTVALVPRDVIEKQGAFTLSEALRNVPGVTLQAGEGGGASNTAGDMFNLRGFSANNSLFLDGVRDDGLIARDVFNIEQVEVFMGPTGSDVGRSTAGGYVNQVTKVPTLQRATSANLSYGSASQRRGTVDVNLPFSTAPNTWLGRSAVRLNAVLQDSGVVSRQRVSGSRLGVAPALAMGLGTRTRVTASAQLMRQENLPDYGVPGAAWRDMPLAPTTVVAARDVDTTQYYGNVSDYDDATQASYSVRFEHDLNRRNTLRHQARYNRTHREAVITAIGNPAAFNPATGLVTVTRQGNDRENTILSNQTSLTTRFRTGRLAHASTLGVEFTSERQDAPTLGTLGTPAPLDLFAPNALATIPGANPTPTGATSLGDANTAAAYIFDTVDLTSRLQVSGGVRAERYRASVKATDAAGTVTNDQRVSDSLVSGRAGIVFRLSSLANLYASVGSAVTPPGTANFALSAQVNNQNNPSTKPQRATNIEAGGKWDAAGGRLSLNGAVFHTVNTNVIFTLDATAIPPIFNQDDEQAVTGATVGVLGKVSDGWQVLANVGYLEGTFRSQNVATDGNRLVLTPRLSGSIWSTYRVRPALTLGGGVRFTDEVFVNAANTIRVPGYAVADGLVEYEVSSRLSLRLNGYNLTNQSYIRNISNNGGRYNPSQGRSVLLTSGLRF